MFKPHSYAGMGMGCLLYIIIYAGIAHALQLWMTPRAGPGLGHVSAYVAAVFFTLAAGTLCELLKRMSTGSDPRADMLQRAERGELPESDGPIIAAGKVRPTSGTLKAPLSGVDCVAYFYRVYYVTYTLHEGSRRRGTVPVYWGYACRPFTVDTRMRALRIQAPPLLQYPALQRTAPEDFTRARQYIASTTFEDYTGLLDSLGDIFSIHNATASDDDGACRKDSKLSGDTHALESLFLEETALAVGDTISLSGLWSAERSAVIPAPGAPLTITRDHAQALGVNSRLPVGNLGAVIWFAATLATGTLILWLGIFGTEYFVAL